MAGRQCYCETCGRTMDEGQFYLSRNIEKYPPDGRMTQCKKCLTMFVDNWNPDTFVPILQEIDVPYVKEEWDKTLERELEKTDPNKITGMTIIGKYLAKMRIKQFKDSRFADSEKLQAERDALKRKALAAQGNDEETIEKTLAADAARQVAKPAGIKGAMAAPSQEILDEQEEEIDLGLSDEDITYLRLKWGRGYTHAQWVQMEQLYNDMCESFDIQTAAHKDTLKLICKTSLQANEAIDMHDVETYQKLSKVYDLLMKSGKFNLDYEKLFLLPQGFVI